MVTCLEPAYLTICQLSMCGESVIGMHCLLCEFLNNEGNKILIIHNYARDVT